MVLDHGQKSAEGRPDAVMDDPEVVRAYLGSAHAEIAAGRAAREVRA